MFCHCYLIQSMIIHITNEQNGNKSLLWWVSIAIVPSCNIDVCCVFEKDSAGDGWSQRIGYFIWFDTDSVTHYKMNLIGLVKLWTALSSKLLQRLNMTTLKSIQFHHLPPGIHNLIIINPFQFIILSLTCQRITRLSINFHQTKH